MTFPTFCLLVLVTLFAVGVAAACSGRRHRASKHQATSYDLSEAIRAHVSRTGCTVAHAERMDHEFRRWFVVAAASPVLLGMASKEVDEYWHTLLEVDGGNLYRRFSEAVCGRRLPHVEGVGSDDLSARAWVAWEATWGTSPPADLFTRPPEEAMERYRKEVRSSSSSDGGDSSLVSLDFGSSCGGGDGGHGCGGGDAGHGCGGGGDGGGCGGGGE